MTDREQKIAEIREALEKATQGPWKWIDPGGLERKKLVGEWEIMNFGIGGVYDQVAGSEPDEDDARLIANAPEWLRFLLDELDRLRAEREAHAETTAALERVKADIATVMDQLADAVDERDEALAERDKLIEVLRWYADTKNYEYRTSYLDQDAQIIDDSGQRARDILREVGVTVE